MRPLLLAGLALLLAAGSSGASTISAGRDQTMYGEKGGSYRAHELVVTAGPGEANAVTMRLSRSGMTVTDAAGATPGAGCERGADARTVECPGFVSRARITLDDGDDRATVAGTAAVMDGGDGDDVLESTWSGPSLLRGGAGDDVLTGSGGSTLIGGPGADVMSSPTAALVSYADRTEPVTVTLDGRADDGAAGEGDLVGDGIHEVVGGAGDDLMVGDDHGDELAGGPGDDRLTGGTGNDILRGGAGADTLTGGAGEDYLDGFADDDRSTFPEEGSPTRRAAHDGPGTLDGGSGADSIVGGDAADEITPGPGRDLIEGGGGGDLVLARDAGRDLVGCSGARGAPSGTAQLDALDLARRCATVDRDAPGRPRITLLGVSDVDPNGTIRIGVGCSQDEPAPCRVHIRVSRAGRTLVRRTMTIARGTARLARPRVPLPASVFRSCRTTPRLTVSIGGRDTRGRPVRSTATIRVGSLSVACPLPSLLMIGPDAGW